MAIGKYKKLIDFFNSLIVKSGTSWIFDPAGVISGDRANFRSVKELLNNIVVVGTDGDENSSTLNMGDITSYATSIAAPDLDMEQMAIRNIAFSGIFVVNESALWLYIGGLSDGAALPSLATVPAGYKVVFKRVGFSSTANFDITPDGTDTIDGVNADLVENTADGAVTLVSSGAGWYVIGRN